uniref:Secreted protein n=1 Tax=Pyxicephalus adspersus TaxID=30357 RepID=A0AAV2ZHI9_PYXAD|nr:TPA: hypothetical protein GDO54_002311 [Pyxicephalus adspersus]
MRSDASFIIFRTFLVPCIHPPCVSLNLSNGSFSVSPSPPQKNTLINTLLTLCSASGQSIQKAIRKAASHPGGFWGLQC